MTNNSRPVVKHRIALISMYDGLKLPGLVALTQLSEEAGQLTRIVDVRQGEELPSLEDFDVLVSSGGPGDPTELGTWGQSYADLIDNVRVHNVNHPDHPKRAFLVCHSFQVMSHYWGLGEINKRDCALWGIQPQIPDAMPADARPVFPTDEFYGFESRFYQVMPTHDLDRKCAQLDIVIAARDDVGALTAWQTRDGHIAATQFHPEAQMGPIKNMLDHPPEGDFYTINMCSQNMRDVTRTRFAHLPVMNKLLADFVTRVP